jgi:hypothetical protein
MSTWLNPAANLVVGAVAVALLVRHRDRGVLRRIGSSKRRFRAWLRGITNRPDPRQ